jgi:hypothetical protein
MADQVTTADFTADELATLARFDATPAAPESWGGGAADSALRARAAREMWAADVGLPIDLLPGETPEPYYRLADAALTVLAAHLGQQPTCQQRHTTGTITMCCQQPQGHGADVKHQGSDGSEW